MRIVLLPADCSARGAITVGLEVNDAMTQVAEFASTPSEPLNLGTENRTGSTRAGVL